MSNIDKRGSSFSVSRNTLQIIAIITMLIDHFNTALNPFVILYSHYGVDIEVASGISDFLEGIGRAAFPIFAFLLVDGCRRTRSLPRYVFRLGIFAVLSEFCYDFAFDHDYPSIFPLKNLPNVIHEFRPVSPSSVMISLFCGALFILAIQKITSKEQHRYWSVIKLSVIFIVLYLASAMLSAEYYQIALPMITLLYFCAKRRNQIIILAGSLGLFYWLMPICQNLSWGNTLRSALHSSPIGFEGIVYVLVLLATFWLIQHYDCNAKSSPRKSRAIYWVYPAHLVLFGILADFLYTYIYPMPQ